MLSLLLLCCTCTYERDPNNLNLIVPVVVVVTNKESASIQIDWEEGALYLKAPDEDTLILSHGGILLFMKPRRSINVCRLNVA